MPKYQVNQLGSWYQFGDVSGFVHPLTALGYNPDLKWETTSTYNVGMDFGFLNDRITAGFDVYYRNTTDMINKIPVPSMGNLTNEMNVNIGSMVNKGFEFNVNAMAVDTKDWTWSVQKY